MDLLSLTPMLLCLYFFSFFFSYMNDFRYLYMIWFTNLDI